MVVPPATVCAHPRVHITESEVAKKQPDSITRSAAGEAAKNIDFGCLRMDEVIVCLSLSSERIVFAYRSGW